MTSVDSKKQYQSVSREIREKTVLISGSKRCIKLWDVKEAKCITTIEGHTSWVDSICVLSSEKIASASDKTIKIWSLDTGQCIQTMDDAHKDDINSLIIINENLVASSSDDQMVKIWDITSGDVVRTLEGHQGGVKCLLSIPSIENQLIASGSDDGIIRIWNVHTGKCVRNFNSHESTIWHLIWVKGNNIISASDDNSIKIWNLTTGESKEMKGHSQAVFSLSYIPEDKLASCSADQTIKIWNLQTLSCLKTILMGHAKNINSLLLLNDKEIASGSNDKTIKIWSLSTFKCVKMLSGHTNGVFAMALKKGSKRRGGAEEKEKEIVDFLIQKNFFNFTINFGNGKTVRCFKPLLLNSQIDLEDVNEIGVGDDDKEYRSNSIQNLEMDNIDEGLLVKILFGINNLNIRPEDYFGYYCFFSRLKMKKMMYCLCKKVEGISELKTLLILFLKSVRKFEKPSKTMPGENFFEEEGNQGEIQFKSVFTLNLFNLLKKNEKTIMETERFTEFLDRLDYLSKLKYFKITKISLHEEFSGVDLSSIQEYTNNDGMMREYFCNVLEKLYEKKKYHNLMLLSQDGMKFKVHKEVLIFRSNFFYTMFKFPGKEMLDFEKNNTVTVLLTGKELIHLLQFIYLDKMYSADLEVCFKLLVHAEMYFEIELEEFLIDKINQMFHSSYKEKTLELTLLKYGYLMRSLVKKLMDLFMDYWVLNFETNETLILKLIGQSQEIHKQEENYKKKISALEEDKKQKNEIQRKQQLEIEKLRMQLEQMQLHKVKLDDDDDNTADTLKKNEIIQKMLVKEDDEEGDLEKEKKDENV